MVFAAASCFPNRNRSFRISSLATGHATPFLFDRSNYHFLTIVFFPPPLLFNNALDHVHRTWIGWFPLVPFFLWSRRLFFFFFSSLERSTIGDAIVPYPSLLHRPHHKLPRQVQRYSDGNIRICLPCLNLSCLEYNNAIRQTNSTRSDSRGGEPQDIAAHCAFENASLSRKDKPPVSLPITAFAVGSLPSLLR